MRSRLMQSDVELNSCVKGPGLKATFEAIDNRTDFKSYMQNYAVARNIPRGPRREGPYEEGFVSNRVHRYCSSLTVCSFPGYLPTSKGLLMRCPLNPPRYPKSLIRTGVIHLLLRLRDHIIPSNTLYQEYPRAQALLSVLTLASNYSGMVQRFPKLCKNAHKLLKYMVSGDVFSWMS